MNSRTATILLGAAWMGMPLASSFAADRYSPQNGYHGDLTLLTGPNVTSPEREKIRQLAVQTLLEQLQAHRAAVLSKKKTLAEPQKVAAPAASPPARQPDAATEPTSAPPPAPAPKP